MYRVYIYDQKEYSPLYEPLDEDLRIFNPILTQELGCAGYFEFQILKCHPNYNRIGVLKTEIIIYNGEKEIFRGRILKPKTTIENIVSLTCEGELTYLLDSRQRPFEYTGGIEKFIEAALKSHNDQVDDFKKIYKGNIVVADTITISDSNYSTTLDVLKKRLVEERGGYLRIRRENKKNYLDYVWDYGGYNEQVIRFGENLLELNHYIDATSLITCLIPTGASVEYADETGKKYSKKLDITSVNNGLDYIQNAEAIKKYGKIVGYQSWNDITDPNQLLQKAEKYLKEASALPSSIEVNAIDLSQIKTDVREFNLGCWTNISSIPHGIDKEYMLIKRVINLLDPTQGSITLGENIKTFTESVTQGQANAIQSIKDFTNETSREIEEKIINATNLINGALGGYVVIDNIDPKSGKVTHPWRILIMNMPDKKTATHVVQLNQNGIGFSKDGINGPYKNAWGIDGNLIADFITGGTMLANRIRGGTLELGGTGLGKDGVILIKNESGKTVGQFGKNGITIYDGDINITSGSINLGKFQVTSGGKLNLDGTSNNTSVGANLVSTNTLNVMEYISASGANFDIGGMSCHGGYVYGSFMGDFHGTFDDYSDRRLKRKITPIDIQLAREIIVRLRPVSFTMRKTGKKMIGFIAQEVIQVCGELKVDLPLVRRDMDGYYCIPYATYVALLAGAIQAQQKQIDGLKYQLKERGGILWQQNPCM